MGDEVTYAFPRCRGSVSFAAEILDFEASVGRCTHECGIRYITRMCHDRYVHAIITVRTGFQKFDLTAAAFFCWRTI